MTKNSFQEDAKRDWLKLVKKHKRKQKGLPALSHLNRNAGNVEHNVSMFNKMNTPVGGPSNNPVSGPFGGDVSAPSSGGMGESFIMENTKMNDEQIELEYSGLQIDYPVPEVDDGGYYDSNFGAYLPRNEGKEIKLLVDWTYTVDKEEVLSVLADLGEVQYELHMDDLSEDDYLDKVEENFDILFDQYKDEIMKYFKPFARDDAEEHYETPSEVNIYLNRDMDEEIDIVRDDEFDMSMRTLL